MWRCSIYFIRVLVVGYLFLSSVSWGQIPLVGIKLDKDKSISFIYRSDEYQDSVLKEQIDYFYTAVSLPSQSLWVNLEPTDIERKLLGKGLMLTNLGKTFLEADLSLKKDAMEMLNSLCEEIIFADNFDISFRLWIVPGRIRVVEDKDSVYIIDAKLDLKIEVGNNGEKLNSILEKELVPALVKRINESKDYESLRRAFYSVILSYWTKFRGIKPSIGYFRYSDFLWTRRAFLEKYQKLYFSDNSSYFAPLLSGGILFTRNPFVERVVERCKSTVMSVRRDLLKILPLKYTEKRKIRSQLKELKKKIKSLNDFEDKETMEKAIGSIVDEFWKFYMRIQYNNEKWILDIYLEDILEYLYEFLKSPKLSVIAKEIKESFVGKCLDAPVMDLKEIIELVFPVIISKKEECRGKLYNFLSFLMEKRLPFFLILLKKIEEDPELYNWVIEQVDKKNLSDNFLVAEVCKGLANNSKILEVVFRNKKQMLLNLLNKITERAKEKNEGNYKLYFLNRYNYLTFALLSFLLERRVGFSEQNKEIEEIINSILENTREIFNKISDDKKEYLFETMVLIDFLLGRSEYSNKFKSYKNFYGQIWAEGRFLNKITITKICLNQIVRNEERISELLKLAYKFDNYQTVKNIFRSIFITKADIERFFSLIEKFLDHLERQGDIKEEKKEEINEVIDLILEKVKDIPSDILDNLNVEAFFRVFIRLNSILIEKNLSASDHMPKFWEEMLRKLYYRAKLDISKIAEISDIFKKYDNNGSKVLSKIVKSMSEFGSEKTEVKIFLYNLSLYLFTDENYQATIKEFLSTVGIDSYLVSNLLLCYTSNVYYYERWKFFLERYQEKIDSMSVALKGMLEYLQKKFPSIDVISDYLKLIFGPKDRIEKEEIEEAIGKILSKNRDDYLIVTIFLLMQCYPSLMKDIVKEHWEKMLDILKSGEIKNWSFLDCFIGLVRNGDVVFDEMKESFILMANILSDMYSYIDKEKVKKVSNYSFIFRMFGALMKRVDYSADTLSDVFRFIPAVYQNKTFLEFIEDNKDKMGPLEDYFLVKAIRQNIDRSEIDKIGEEDLRPILELIWEQKNRIKDKAIFSTDKNVILFYDRDVLPNDKLWKDILVEKIKVKSFESLGHEKETPIPNAEENITKAVRKENPVLIFEEHGLRKYMGRQLSDIADYFIAARPNYDFSDVIIITTSCYGANFAVNFFKELKRRAEKDNKKVKLPIFVTQTMRGMLGLKDRFVYYVYEIIDDKITEEVIKGKKSEELDFETLKKLKEDFVSRGEGVEFKFEDLFEVEMRHLCGIDKRFDYGIRERYNLKHISNENLAVVGVFCPLENESGKWINYKVDLGSSEPAVEFLPDELVVVGMIHTERISEDLERKRRRIVKNSVPLLSEYRERVEEALRFLERRLDDTEDSLSRWGGKDRIKKEAKVLSENCYIFEKEGYLVNSTDDFILAVATRDGDHGKLFLDPIFFSDIFSIEELAEVLLHESLSLIEEEKNHQDHKDRYEGKNAVQRVIMKTDNTLKLSIRRAISKILLERYCRQREKNGKELGFINYLKDAASERGIYSRDFPTLDEDTKMLISLLSGKQVQDLSDKKQILTLAIKLYSSKIRLMHSHKIENEQELEPLFNYAANLVFSDLKLLNDLLTGTIDVDNVLASSEEENNLGGIDWRCVGQR